MDCLSCSCKYSLKWEIPICMWSTTDLKYLFYFVQFSLLNNFRLLCEGVQKRTRLEVQVLGREVKEKWKHRRFCVTIKRNNPPKPKTIFNILLKTTFIKWKRNLNATMYTSFVSIHNSINQKNRYIFIEKLSNGNRKMQGPVS